MPMHSNRIWNLRESTARKAAKEIDLYGSLVLCTGYMVRSSGGQLFAIVNDSTSVNALQEYNVFRLDYAHDAVGNSVAAEKADVWIGQSHDTLTTTWITEKGGAEALEDYFNQAMEDKPMFVASQIRVDPDPNHVCELCR